MAKRLSRIERDIERLKEKISVLSAFCENYHIRFISPLFNSAKIHAKGAIGLQPVSYTHLDVYKRQPSRHVLT